MSLDVFAEHPLRRDLGDDALDFGPQVPRVLAAAPEPADRKRLARVAGSDEIHLAAPRAAVEGASVTPDRCVIQRLVCHPGHEGGRGVGFPLDKANSSIAGLRDMQAELQASKSRAQRET